MRVIAVLPVHDEAGRVLRVLSGVAPLVTAVLVVDDGSTDGSAEEMAAWCASRDDAACLPLGANRGKAPALRAGFASVLAWADAGRVAEVDAVVTLDADGQHAPEQIPDLAARVGPGRADLAIGRRDLSGYPVHKRAGNRLLSLWGAACGGFPFADLECGMRAAKVSALRLILPWCRGRRYAAEHEVGVVAARLGLRIDDGCPLPDRPYVAGARARDALPVVRAGLVAAVRVVTGRAPRAAEAWPTALPPAVLAPRGARAGGARGR